MTPHPGATREKMETHEEIGDPFMSDAPAWLRTTGTHRAPSPPARSGEAPFRVLFVCTGNICRSAFAEILLRARLGPHSTVDVSSAGTMAVVGHDLEQEMAARAGLLDLPHAGHRARQLTGRILAGSDLVLVFEEHHYSWVLDERPDTLPRLLALGQAAAALRSVADGRRVAWEALADTVHALRPEPQPADWVSDPYMRGAQAAAHTATRITEDIGTILAHVTPAPSRRS